MRGLSILVILLLVLVGFGISGGCAKKEKTQEELRKEIEPYLKKLEESYKSTEPLIRGVRIPRISMGLQRIVEKNKPQIIPILIKIIKDKKVSWEVKYNIAKILGCTGSSEIIPYLSDMLENEDEEIWQCAIISLCFNSTDKAIELLIMTLENKKLKAYTLYTLWFMGEGRDEKVWKALIKKDAFKKALESILLTDSNLTHRKFAEGILEEIKENK